MKYVMQMIRRLTRGFSEKVFMSRVILSMVFLCVGVLNAQPAYKEGTAYLIKEADLSECLFFSRYKKGFIDSYYVNYYVVDEKTLLNFLQNDSIDRKRLVFLCDPAVSTVTDSAIIKRVKLSTRLRNILVLDDTEIYEIGGRKYFIRKMRYAYYDNTQIKMSVWGWRYYFFEGDITEEQEEIGDGIYEIGQLYGIDYYQCYHHLVELLPTPPFIQKHLWKRLYQLGE